jgi:signal transduction histidine kinase
MRQLAPLVSNLLNNAAKYTKEKGHIWLTAHQDGLEAVIRVRDDGIGIPAGMLPRIFEMFA